MVKGMEMRGTGTLPGLELLAFASFLSGFCFEEEEQSDSRNILLHPANVLNSLPEPRPSVARSRPSFLQPGCLSPASLPHPPPTPSIPLGNPDLGFSSF